VTRSTDVAPASRRRSGRRTGGRSGVYAATFVARPDSVAHARRALVDALRRRGTPEPVLDDVALAVSEACTNVVLHAYEGEPGRYTLSCAVDPEAIHVRVTDDGHGLAPRPDSTGLGLGLPLMASLAANMALSAAVGGGTTVAMAFAQAGPGLLQPAH
jgi:anti-sigma regulatory factor (Ser/Thr protein kinase)